MQFRIGDWVVSPYANLAERGGEARRLESRAVAVLEYLVKNKERTVSKDELLDAVWQRAAISEHSVTVVISDLRRALGDDSREPRYIQTIPRKGYRLIAEAGFLDPAEARDAEDNVAGRTDALPDTPRRAKRTFWHLPASVGAVLAVLIALAGLTAAPGPGLRLPLSPLPSAAMLTPQQFISRQADGASGALAHESFTTFNGREIYPAFSPDGSRVAFSWNKKGNRLFDIYVKQKGSEQVLQISDSHADDKAPSWSPDGTQIAFTRFDFIDRSRWCRIILVPSIGGAERELADCGETTGKFAGTQWSRDGRYIIAPMPAHDFGQPDKSIISALHLETLKVRSLTAPMREVIGEGKPVQSPDGRMIAFVRRFGTEMTEVLVLDVDEDLVPLGEPRTLLRRRVSIGDLDWMPDSSALIVTMSEDGPFVLKHLPLHGGGLSNALVSSANIYGVSISPDGRSWVLDQREEAIDLARMKLRPDLPVVSSDLKLRARLEWVENTTRFEWAADYSADGSRMVYISDRTFSGEIWMNDLKGRVRQITNVRNDTIDAPRISPDGNSVAFQMGENGNRNIYIMPLQGGKPVRFTTHAGSDSKPEWMPDGRGLYFISNRTGREEVWARELDGGEARQITTFGANRIRLAADKGFYFSRPNDPAIYYQHPEHPDQVTKVMTRYYFRGAKLWDTNGKVIVFLDRDPDLGPDAGFFAFRYDLAARKTERVGQLSFGYATRGFVLNKAGDEITYSVITRWAGDLRHLTVGDYRPRP